MRRGFLGPLALTLVIGTLAFGGTLVVSAATPPTASAINPAKTICDLAGLVSSLAGKVCSAASHAGSLVKAGKKLLSGHLGAALKAVSGASSAAKAVTMAAAFAAAGVWVLGGARVVMHDTAAVINSTTRPQLQSSWFSSSYWRMAGVSALLTLPFLFAAAIQALLRSDMTLLARSVFGYLPLGLLAVGIAAPVTMLLLAASDSMSAIVSSASGGSDVAFLDKTGFITLGVSAVTRSTFLLFFVGLLAVAATLTLWIELLIRSAAVYVIVLMLPLFFAALVWPARRVWAIRAVEMLVALILSKFAIVAVLSLGGAALGHTLVPSASQLLEGTTLVMLAAFSPWALLRLLPLHELASGVQGLRGGMRPLAVSADRGFEASEIAHELVGQLPARLMSRTGGPSGEPSPAQSAVRGLQRSDDAGPQSETEPTEPAERGAPAQPATSSEPAQPAQPATSSEPAERSPGMDPLYQAPNGTVEFVLGPDTLPPPADPEPSPPRAPDREHPAPRAPDPGPPPPRAPDPGPALPPQQDPDEGSL